MLKRAIMPRERRFSLCADDYAMTPGVSRGILEALDAGALTATSVMTTSQYWPDAAAALRRHEGTADIGLHLNLTLGAPLGAMPTLAPEGRLPGIGTLMRLQRQGRLPLDEIGAEIDRQCDAFAQVYGRAPDHVDGHQHVQALRGVRPLLFDALGRRGWHPWLRDSGDRLWRIAWRTGRRKALALGVIGEGFAAQARRAGFRCNDGFSGFSRFDPHERYATAFTSYLKASGPRHLVMCHPGHVDDELRRLDPVVETREHELRFLVSPLFREVLSRANATLARISPVAASQASATAD